MLDEGLEFQISQYADGSLPAEQNSSVEAAVRTDANAAKVLRQYQTMDRHLCQLRKQQNVDWQKLAGHLSRVVTDELSIPGTVSVAGRIVPTVVRWRLGSAIAALLVIALGGSLWMKGYHSISVAPGTAAESTATVSGPQAEVAKGPAVQEIKVGPSPAMARQIDAWRYANGAASQGPSKVTITAAVTPLPRPDSHLR